ncbi:MAG: PadR family transcriptional regulator [Saprospiraceae bacterium]|nr:PadR family transcriptional regulator [Saprospiraceae bacterium]
MNYDNAIAQMKKGVLEMCILAILNQKDAYPSDIIQRLKESDLIVVEGTLYPLLSRLKNSSLLDYYWIESQFGPPRKYYKITESGKLFLDQLLASWNSFVLNVNQSLNHNINS